MNSLYTQRLFFYFFLRLEIFDGFFIQYEIFFLTLLVKGSMKSKQLEASSKYGTNDGVVYICTTFNLLISDRFGRFKCFSYIFLAFALFTSKRSLKVVLIVV